MSILRHAQRRDVPDDVAYHCPRHGQFWLQDGQLRQEEPHPQYIRSLPLNVDIDPIPRNCPYCGARMTIVLRGVSGEFTTYHCLTHGRFWLDHDGALREERRTPDRPKTPAR